MILISLECPPIPQFILKARVFLIFTRMFYIYFICCRCNPFSLSYIRIRFVLIGIERYTHTRTYISIFLHIYRYIYIWIELYVERCSKRHPV